MIELFELIHTSLGLPTWVNHGATIGFIIGAAQLIYTMIRVFTFSYYFYIDHGFMLVSAATHPNKIITTLKKQGKTESMFAKGYCHAFILSILSLAFWTVLFNFWYVTLPIFGTIGVIILPTGIIKFLSKEKRNKVVFEQKLDGTYPDELT